MRVKAPSSAATARSASPVSELISRESLGPKRPAPIPRGDNLRAGPLDDPTNPINPVAVKVSTSTGEAIGYVPDLLLEHLEVVRATGPVDVSIEHVNGPDAPPHLRVLVRLVGRAPAGYRP